MLFWQIPLPHIVISMVNALINIGLIVVVTESRVLILKLASSAFKEISILVEILTIKACQNVYQ